MNEINILIMTMIILCIIIFLTLLFASKCKSNKIKILVVKIFLSLGLIPLVLMLLLYIQGVYSGMMNDELGAILGIIMAIVACPALTLLSSGAVEISKKEEFDTDFQTFDSFSKFIKEKMIANKYTLIKNDQNIQIYKTKRHKDIKLFINIYSKNIDRDILKMILDEINDSIKDETDFIIKHNFSRLEMTYILNTETYDEIIDWFTSRLGDGRKIFKMVGAIVYKDKKIYLRDALEGFNFPNQKRMYNELLELLNIKTDK